jgi:(2Fe-2S) ferredoxin
MKKPTYHILVCNSYRTAEETADRGLDVAVSTTACLNVCGHKPVMVVHPNNYWYGGVTEEAIDEILDALEVGKPVEKYLISEEKT